MPNPLFYERQRRRFSTWNVPRFLYSYDETLTGDLILPRGLEPTLRRLVDDAVFATTAKSGFEPES